MIDTEFQAKRAFLFSYLDELKEETRLSDELEQVRARLTRVSPDLSGMPRGEQGHDLADGIQSLIDAELRLCDQITRSLAARDAVRRAIDTVPDARQRLVLAWRFVNGRPLEKLPEEVHYTLRHIKRLYRDGVNAIELPPQKDVTKCH